MQLPDGREPLYRSHQAGIRDPLGNLGKICAPTVADGRMYVATHSNAVAGYGLWSK